PAVQPRARTPCPPPATFTLFPYTTLFRSLLLAVGLYNAPKIAWKGRPPFDVLIQASYLLVFVLSSWLNNARQLPWQTFLFGAMRSEEHTSELQSREHVVCRLLLANLIGRG